jgi:hypothetical protein
MNTLGGLSLGTVVIDEDANSFTLTAEGVTGDGEETEFKGVVTKKDEHTITWRALHRQGGIVEGPGPEYTFKRVKRAKRVKPARS